MELRRRIPPKSVRLSRGGHSDVSSTSAADESQSLTSAESTTKNINVISSMVTSVSSASSSSSGAQQAPARHHQTRTDDDDGHARGAAEASRSQAASQQLPVYNQNERDLRSFIGTARSVAVPMSLCMLLAAIFVRLPDMPDTDSETHYEMQYDGSQSLLSALFGGSSNGEVTAMDALVAALIFLSVVVACSVFLVTLLWLKCVLILRCWVYLALVLITFMASIRFIWITFAWLNWPIDYVSALFLCMNWSSVGCIALFTESPFKVLRTMVVVLNCSMLGATLGRLVPVTTIWMIMLCICFWDLFAVLAPCGPLRLLIDQAMQNKDIEHLAPAIVFSGMAWRPTSSSSQTNISAATSDQDQNVDDVQVRQLQRTRPNVVQLRRTPRKNAKFREEATRLMYAHQSDSATQSGLTTTTSSAGEKSLVAAVQYSSSHNSLEPHQLNYDNETRSMEPEEINIGLGDFVFFATVIATTSISGSSFLSVFVAYCAISCGMVFTLYAAVRSDMAVPALPASLFTCAALYAVNELVAVPFALLLALNYVQL